MTSRDPTRREFLHAAMAASATLLAPLHSLAAAVKPVTIREVDIFPIEIPVSRAEHDAGLEHQYIVVRIGTDVGVSGYSFAGPRPGALPEVRKVLVGQDLFAIDRHLRHGLIQWGGVEHAVWDAIGKIAGQPVSRLLGGAADRVKAYVTCVWKGKLDQSQVAHEEQAGMAVKLKRAGFKGMKIRAWRPDPMDDVAACRVIKQAVGPDFAVMFDRTADRPRDAGQPVWDYETGRKVARGLQQQGAYWLEEPFAREDYLGPARLAAEVDIPITGGEGYRGLEPFRECLIHKTYDILQPEGSGSGGILTCVQVAALARAFRVPCILHGSMALRVAGWLQATLAFGSEWQELALVTPPLLPEEQWSPGLKVLRSKEVFTIRDGMILAPEHPGIGLDVDVEAIERFRRDGGQGASHRPTN
jgi:L-alanine-DL-glutamate epimerase-like enolase superfamily enzyme